MNKRNYSYYQRIDIKIIFNLIIFLLLKFNKNIQIYFIQY